MARIIDQGSRLSAVRLAQSHAACELLNLNGFNEDDLYTNLDWLCDNQEAIENRLFALRHNGSEVPRLFWLSGDCRGIIIYCNAKVYKKTNIYYER